MRLYNCDNIEFMKKLLDNEFDLAICDPPYGIGKDWKRRNKGAVFAETSYDNKRATKEYFDEIRRVAKHYIVFGYNYYTEFFGSTNYLIVWDKLSSDNQVFKYSKCELACTDIHIPCNIVHCEWDVSVAQKRYIRTKNLLNCTSGFYLITQSRDGKYLTLTWVAEVHL